MLYYIVKWRGETKFTIHSVKNPTDSTYRQLIRNDEVEEIRGQFGKKDYVEIWCDYHNGLIDIKEVNKRLYHF
jgi:hypothetical protein